MTEEWKYGQRAITVMATDKVIKKRWIDIAGCNLYYVAGFMICRKKSEITFTRWSKGIGKVVIYKALHEGGVN